MKLPRIEMIMMIYHFKLKTMSLQFPIKEKKVKIESIQLNQRASVIFLGIKENCPNLYKYIKAVKS